MLALIVRRLIQLPIILLAIYTITLSLAWILPGSPVDRTDGRRPSPQVIAQMEKQYNLDNGFKFYWSYLDGLTGLRYARDRFVNGRIAGERARAAEAGLAPPRRFVFDMGPSLFYVDQTVNEVVGASLWVSVTLGAMSILIALAIGVGAGVVGAIRPNSLLDLATLVIALVGISLPSFVIGTVLLLVFALWLGLAPVASWGPSGAILPALTLSLPFAAYIARLTRMGMIENLGSDYIRTARAKGVSERAILLRHALKNAFLPVLSFLGPACALAMTGSFIVERVFTVPGMGQHFVNAVQNKDLSMIIGVVMVFSTLLILFNLIVDVLYRWVDPRIE